MKNSVSRFSLKNENRENFGVETSAIRRNISALWNVRIDMQIEFVS